jgi:hypothetical protein
MRGAIAMQLKLLWRRPKHQRQSDRHASVSGLLNPALRPDYVSVTSAPTSGLP